MYKTKQENFWRGSFGDEYSNRVCGENRVINNVAFFCDIFRKIDCGCNSIIEFGANIGLNLEAIRILKPSITIDAIEINNYAVDKLRKNKKIGINNVYETSILDFQTNNKWDIVLIKGVLIHINPDELKNVYNRLYECSNKYIIISEYYNTTPVSVDYRGNEGVLFKRDFAGEMLDLYPDLRLLDYGFSYHRDNNFPQDDITWFLLEKCD